MKLKRSSVLLCAGGAAVAFWFLGVHRCERYRYCDACLEESYYADTQVFGLTIWRTTYWNRKPLIAKIARDLGAPCQHPNWKDHIVNRYWGLCFCPNPHNVSTITGELRYNYTDHFQRVIGKLGLDNPQLPEEFRQRVLDQHDWTYLDTFLQTLEPSLGPDEFPQDGQ